MKSKESISISDFARLARTTSSVLRFYEEKGLICPKSRSSGGSRRYSVKQLASVNLIHTCKELGMSLNEIKTLINYRTPALVDELLTEKIVQINEIVDQWHRSQKLLTVLQQIIHAARNEETEAITVKSLPAQPIVLGGLNDYSNGRDDYDALLDFYLSFGDPPSIDIDLNYPVWGVFSKENILNGEITWPDRYYFYDPDGLERRRAGLYAVGYSHGGYGEIGNLFKRMLEYIDINGYTICGPAYAEYPLNEICVANPSDYLTRLFIAVRKRD